MSSGSREVGEGKEPFRRLDLYQVEEGICMCSHFKNSPILLFSLFLSFSDSFAKGGASWCLFRPWAHPQGSLALGGWVPAAELEGRTTLTTVAGAWGPPHSSAADKHLAPCPSHTGLLQGCGVPPCRGVGVPPSWYTSPSTSQLD